ncbi:unnamed protein product [Schistocephalus solidus]|uniref:Uncharacterized protein n=1 Tax=Schistocephalus solidus TaxID=70667 RepID=A0A183SH70_SCHSO|nr:unnamed protein product [Schistocephalus solidus]
MGSHRQGGQLRPYKDTPKISLKQLQIYPVTWEDFAWNRTAWRSTLKTGAAIYEANRITAAKAKRAAKSHQLPGPKTPLPKPFQHVCTVNAPSTHQLVWRDIFRRNATTFRQFKLLRQLLPTLLQPSPPSPLASIPLLPPL